MYKKNFDYIKIAIASPQKILEWSTRKNVFGLPELYEVLDASTFDFQTYKPEPDGLFCEKIFGPVKDNSCFCEEYTNVRLKKIICEKCGVEVTSASVRQYRMSFIELTCTLTHIWYLDGLPSYLTLVLNSTSKELKEIIYFSKKKKTKIQKIKYFKTLEGSDLIAINLARLNLRTEIMLNRMEILICEDIKRKRLIKRIRILENFLATGTRLIWMMVSVLPIIPPGLRPMMELEGGRFALSDLNELYKNIIVRNNRVGRMIDLDLPKFFLHNEKRLLQEGLDALIDNGKCEKNMILVNNRPLKSLADILRGKYGIFRQNLLGKRVDYSGRSVIVVDPYLKLNQFGLPYEMAVELFKPFLIYELINSNLALNIEAAYEMIEKNPPKLLFILKILLNGFPVLLNRAPTLHRVSIQAFEPKIIEGRAIKLHPLVCSAFNADFDGDQMGIHVPLSLESQSEAYLLMLSSNNIMSLASNTPVILPSQDMVLGCHYLTITTNKYNNLFYFLNFENALHALENKIIGLHSKIWVKYNGFIQFNKKSKFIKTYKIGTTVIDIYTNYQIRKNLIKKTVSNYILTTPGRIIMNRVILNVLNY